MGLNKLKYRNLEYMLDAEDLIKKVVNYKIKIQEIPHNRMKTSDGKEITNFVYGYVDIVKEQIVLNALASEKSQVQTLIHEGMHLYFDYEMKLRHNSRIEHEMFIEKARILFTRKNPCVEEYAAQLIEESEIKRDASMD